jgi:PAS domain S-box-containing protein
MDLIHQETDTMYWSPMVREILEVDDDYNPSLTGGLEFNMGESYEKIKTAIDLLITNGTPFDEETLVRTAKGNERWVRAIGKLEIINGKPIKIYGSYQDIHFSKSLELKVSEILESISDAFFAVDKDWRITYWNEEAELIMGKTRKQVIGKHLWEEYPDAIDSDFYREYHKSMKTGEKADFEEFYPALSKWLQVSVYPSKNGLSIYFKDISERKKAEEENNQLQITIENSMNEIYTFDATTLQFNYANRGALLNLGYSKKEITSFSPHHIKTGYTEASFKQLIQPLLSKEKEKIIFFTNHQRKDGSKYPVETHLQLVSEGIHPQFLAIAMDLTEHKKAEEMYRLLADHTNDLICMHNSDTSITYLSPSIKNLLGFEPEELLGKQVFDLIHKDDIKPVKEAIRDTFFQGVIIETFAYRARHKKGHYLWLETLGSPVIQDKEVISFVTSSRNITQAMLVKQEIQEYQSSLQRLTSEMSFIEENQKKQIAANIHDHLSQSLVISKMKISNLEKRTELKDIVEDLGFIKSHISEALENSRKITYELSPPILFQLGLIEALDWYTEEIQEKYGIEFRFNSTIDSFHFDEFKSILIFRCVQEVVTNAIKYAKASLMTLEFIVEDTAIVLFVKDNGIGFNIGNLKGLNSSDGGFGLFKVQERIRNMKGEFSITSALQKGTVVKISVPL